MIEQVTAIKPTPQAERYTTLDQAITMKPTPRVERLRQKFFTYKPTVELDRIRNVTKAMKETEGEPMVIRRAKAFAATVRGMPINIYPDELIVAFQASVPRGNSVYVDQYGGWLEAELDTLGTRQWDQFLINEQDKKELRDEIFPYWKGQGKYEKTVDGRTYQQFPTETADLLFGDPDVYPTFGTGIIDVDVLRIMHIGHITVNYQKVLKKGFLGIKEDAESRLAGLDYTNPDELRKIPFLRAAAMAMEAATDLGSRFAAKARDLAASEQNVERKADLEKIAGVCEQVPALPARTFHEALQSVWFTQILLKYEANGDALSPGRIDQYLYPYYKADIEQGRLSKEEAQELIDCFFLKFAEVVDLWNTNACRFYAGFPVTQQVNVGGLKRDGNDATNDLSYMFIESMMHTRLIQPTFSVLVHNKTPEDLLIKACQLTALGTGHPSFFNEEVIIPSILARGSLGGPRVELEDARDHAMMGCVEPQMAGMDAGYSNGGVFNLGACMEFVMTNGVSRAFQRKVGAETGDPRKFESFDQVLSAFEKQVAWMVRNIAVAENICELAQAELFPSPFQSALVEDCIENGIDKQSGGARYNFGPSPLGVGVADCGDSLAAIKKVVFDDKKITMARLCDALDNDFQGYDDVGQLLLGAPKWGNDDDYVDQLTAWAVHLFAKEVVKYKNTRGGHLLPGIIPVSANVPLGMALGALPSGRKAGLPLAEGCSPFPGMDRKGPTAALKSVGKMDHALAFNGTQLNMRIDPAVFHNGNEGVKRIADLMRAIVDQKIWHIQFNVVSSDTLKAAQKEPDNYRDLVVKVAGYNAFFVELDETIQNNVIARTEHSF